MPLTELVLPNLKQDPTSITLFQTSVLPSFAHVLSVTANIGDHYFGHMIEEDGVSTQGTFRPVLGTSWKQEQDFHAAIASQEFQAFIPAMISIAAAPTQPQLFETNRGPDAVFSSALMEVHRIKVPNDTAVAEATEAWKAFTSTIVKGSDVRETHLLSGTSLNLEEKTFVGIIGWHSNQIREATLKDTAVVPGRNALLDLNGATSFLAGVKD